MGIPSTRTSKGLPMCVCPESYRHEVKMEDEVRRQGWVEEKTHTRFVC